MAVGLLIGVSLGFMSIFTIGICLICRCKSSDGKISGALVSFVGLLLLCALVFGDVPAMLPSGLPKTSIDNGEYKVAFVYVAGENINVGIEKKYSDKERLFLYQFPRSAFDGEPNLEAEKLVIVESDGFRKLVLR